MSRGNVRIDSNACSLAPSDVAVNLLAVSSCPTDLVHARKARGAFFTPPAIADVLVRWAIRSPDARVTVGHQVTDARALDPTCGEAVFLLASAKTAAPPGGTARRDH